MVDPEDLIEPLPGPERPARGRPEDPVECRYCAGAVSLRGYPRWQLREVVECEVCGAVYRVGDWRTPHWDGTAIWWPRTPGS